MEKNEWIRERETIRMSAVSWAASGGIGRRAGVAPVAGASSTAPAETGKNLRMKAARVAADLSQADLAAAVGANRPTQGVGCPPPDHRPHRSRRLQSHAQTVHRHL